MMGDFSGPEVRAMRLVIDEVRSSLPPAVDWEGLERRTLASIDAELRSAPHTVRANPSGMKSALGFAAVAAALVMLITGQRAGSVPSSAALELASVPMAGPGMILASAIASGSRVDVGEVGRRFVWPGVAQWDLAPGTSVVMTREGGAPTIVLERGAVTARAVSRRVLGAPVESFVVEAGGARIAVHGTTFSVAIDGDRVILTVDEGAVSIGRAGKPGGAGDAIVKGPGSAAFSSRDGRLLELNRESSPVFGALPENTARAFSPGPFGVPTPSLVARSFDGSRPTAGAEPADAVVSELPPPLASSGIVEVLAEPAHGPISLASVQRELTACVASEAREGDLSLRVTASTDVRLGLDAEHRVSTVRFDPPLRADLQQRCASSLLGRVVEGAGPNPTVRVEFAPR